MSEIKCPYYHTRTTLQHFPHPTRGIMYDMDTVSICWGTKEQDECSCGGDRSKCDFYPEYREQSKEEYRMNIINRKRLIDANKAIISQWYGNSKPIVYRQYAVSVLKNAPTVDAVEVVRCKDCKFERLAGGQAPRAGDHGPKRKDRAERRVDQLHPKGSALADPAGYVLLLHGARTG